MSAMALAAASQDTICREVACEALATNLGYCRMHYVKNWRRVQRKEALLREGRLNQFISELLVKYPMKYIEALRADLADNKLFTKVIQDLELAEAVEEGESQEDESIEGIVDSIRREVEVDDTEGDAF